MEKEIDIQENDYIIIDLSYESDRTHKYVCQKVLGEYNGFYILNTSLKVKKDTLEVYIEHASKPTNYKYICYLKKDVIDCFKKSGLFEFIEGSKIRSFIDDFEFNR